MNAVGLINLGIRGLGQSHVATRIYSRVDDVGDVAMASALKDHLNITDDSWVIQVCHGIYEHGLRLIIVCTLGKKHPPSLPRCEDSNDSLGL